MSKEPEKLIEEARESGQQRLNDYIISARKSGMSDEQIKKKLLEIAWNEEDINATLAALPASAKLSWRTTLLNAAEFIVTYKKSLIAIGFAVLLASFGFRNFYIYLSTVKIQNEAVAQLLQSLPEEQKECVMDNVDKAFLEKLQTEDPKVIAQDAQYKEQFISLGECVLHKAKPL
jgi:hypothetical protein